MLHRVRGIRCDAASQQMNAMQFTWTNANIVHRQNGGDVLTA